jgi:hypothetical protein
VFTLPFDEATGGFDDRALVEFLSDDDQPRDAIEIAEHFFVHDRRPIWALLVSYRDLPRPGMRPPETDGRKDWRLDLDARDRAVFDALRAWRGSTARREGTRRTRNKKQETGNRQLATGNENTEGPVRPARPAMCVIYGVVSGRFWPRRPGWRRAHQPLGSPVPRRPRPSRCLGST